MPTVEERGRRPWQSAGAHLAPRCLPALCDQLRSMCRSRSLRTSRRIGNVRLLAAPTTTGPAEPAPISARMLLL